MLVRSSGACTAARRATPATWSASALPGKPHRYFPARGGGALKSSPVSLALGRKIPGHRSAPGAPRSRRQKPVAVQANPPPPGPTQAARCARGGVSVLAAGGVNGTEPRQREHRSTRRAVPWESGADRSPKRKWRCYLTGAGRRRRLLRECWQTPPASRSVRCAARCWPRIRSAHVNTTRTGSGWTRSAFRPVGGGFHRAFGNCRAERPSLQTRGRRYCSDERVDGRLHLR